VLAESQIDNQMKELRLEEFKKEDSNEENKRKEM